MAKRFSRKVSDRRRPAGDGFDPSQARGALGKAFVNAIADDFARHGADKIKALREQRPYDYLRLVAALLPKEFRIKEVEISDLTDDEFTNTLIAIRNMIAEQEKAQSGEAEPAADQPDGTPY